MRPIHGQVITGAIRPTRFLRSRYQQSVIKNLMRGLAAAALLSLPLAAPAPAPRQPPPQR